MPSIAITGGIACGKSLVMTFLTNLYHQNLSSSKKSVSFFNADKEVAGLLDHDASVTEEIKATFGNQSYDKEGKVDRSYLRSLILASPNHKKDLEAILHPRLRKIWHPQAMAARDRIKSADPLFIAEIPLLYENNLATYFDRVIVVAASEQLQMERLKKHRNFSSETARNFLQLQLPLADKINRANHVLWNDGKKETLEAELQLAIYELLR